MSRSRRTLTVLLAATLGLAACGSEGGSDGGRDTATSTTTTAEGSGAVGDQGPAPDAENAFEPVTIEHRWGSTEITEVPERVVTIDIQWTDVLLALGTTPVGYVADPTADGPHAWQGDQLDDATAIPYSDTIPFEQVAALQPDLIVATFAIDDQSTYDQLSGIAPTIGALSDAEVDSWQDMTTVGGQVLGEQGTAQTLIADVDAQVQDLADELPGLDGKTIAFANYVPGDAFYVLANPDDGANTLFAQLGLDIAPGVAAEGADSSGRVKLSLEQAELLDGDVLLVLTNGADPEEIVGWDSLPAVESGAALEVDYAVATALNTPSPLSLPWALDTIRPALEAAAG